MKHCQICKHVNTTVDIERPKLPQIPVKAPWYHWGLILLGPSVLHQEMVLSGSCYKFLGATCNTLAHQFTPVRAQCQLESAANVIGAKSKLLQSVTKAGRLAVELAEAATLGKTWWVQGQCQGYRRTNFWTALIQRRCSVGARYWGANMTGMYVTMLTPTLNWGIV